jgi:hypothetical protein
MIEKELPKCYENCGIQEVRPGKVQCWCDNPESAENHWRENLAQQIEDYADRGYQGVLKSSSAHVLEVGGYIKQALLDVATMTRGNDESNNIHNA